jgi:anaphase-promoting complex subunit 3
MANVFKMTPEMMTLLSTSSNEETPLGILDESPPTNALAQSQVNVNAQLPSTNDPFSISKNRINGDVRGAGSLALFDRFNSKRSAVVSKDEIVRPDVHILDTPTGPPGDAEDPIFTDKDAGEHGPTEPPKAPMRKVRALPGLGMDFNVDAPPKMASNPIARSKSRSRDESGELDSITVSRSSTISTGGHELKRTVSGKVPQTTSGNPRTEVAEAATDPGAPQRRSVRLYNSMKTQTTKFAASTGSIGAREGRELKKAKATGTKGRSTNSYVGRVVSGNRKNDDRMDIDGKEQRPLSHSVANIVNPKPVVNEKVKEYESVQWLLDLFLKLGSGYFALSHYQCQDALRMFNSITPSQRETPWVLAQMGRAHYEQTSYLEAEKTFTRIKTIAPSRLEDMEIYSTILWHLKHDIDLAFLAHEIVEIDRESPQAWCAVGNSFSLQRDHDQALKCFKRATQLDPKFAYAFTLQGHEHVSNEEYDKALSAYRAAISAESRHYNAWYGLGKVYEKQGKYAYAEQHYLSAAAINPTNPVLITCIGNVLEKMKNPKAALVQYSKACELDAKSPLCRFKKARVLMTLHEYQKALVELRVLKDIAPDEANVHFLLGKVYKVLRQKGSAIRHFTMALNLDPKVSLDVLPIKDTDAKFGLGLTLYQRSNGANGRRR